MVKFSKIVRFTEKLINSNFLAKRHLKNKRQEFLTKDFIKSDEYNAVFCKYIKDIPAFDEYINDAEDETKNYLYRHVFMNKTLGSWRWKSLFQHKLDIVDVIFDGNKKGIDFGGAYGPIAPHTTIVDFNPKDIFGRKVLYNRLSDIDFEVDFIFSSHTLEHIEEIEDIVKRMKSILSEEGILILNLPSYTCTRWRSGIHSNRKFNDHKWTFLLEGIDVPKDIINPLMIDTLISKHFEIQKACYTGDNCIFILAKNTL